MQTTHGQNVILSSTTLAKHATPSERRGSVLELLIWVLCSLARVDYNATCVSNCQEPQQVQMDNLSKEVLQ